MVKKNINRNRAAVKRQAVRGSRIKTRNIGKVTNRLKELAVYLWYPKLFIGFTALTCVLLAYNSINLNQVLPIQSVKIEGEFDFLNKEELKRKAIPVVVGGFFNVNLPAVREVLVTLPWVENVSVRRQWPDKLLVRVIEKKPVVLWGDDGVISVKGKLFIPAQKPVLNLPHLVGPEGQHQTMLKELSRMQAWLMETGLYIQNIKLNARRSWTLKMTTGMELRLGRKLMHERLNRFVSVYKENLETEKREIKYIDMRYTNGFSVAWKEA